MRKNLIGVVPLAIWCGSLFAAAPAASTPTAAPATASGGDFQYIDNTVRLQDDFFRHVSGKWLDTVEIPADRARYGSFDAFRELSQHTLHEVIESLAKGDVPGDPDAKKIADLYRSFMNEARVEGLGLKPLRSELARI